MNKASVLTKRWADQTSSGEVSLTQSQIPC